MGDSLKYHADLQREADRQQDLVDNRLEDASQTLLDARRLRRVPISTRFLNDMLQGRVGHAPYWEVMNMDMPADCVVVHVVADMTRDCVVAFVRSKTFSVVPEGFEIPEYNPQYRVVVRDGTCSKCAASEEKHG